MINNNKSLATGFIIIVSAFSSIGMVLMTNIANALPIQDFDFSDLNCIGMFNCDLDHESNDTTSTTTQSCESGDNSKIVLEY